MAGRVPADRPTADPPLADLPRFAAWRFVDAVDGFEVLYPQPGRLRGHTAAVEDGVAYAVAYELVVDERWRTREARVACDTVEGQRSVLLRSDGAGAWTVDGRPAPHLDGLVDVDLEASVCTNTLPVHRLALAVGEVAATPAVYVRARDLDVRRLDQRYERVDGRTFRYAAEGGFAATLTYDDAGLVTDYPGLAVRVS